MKRRGVVMAQGKRLSSGGSGVSPPGSIDATGATNVTSSLQAWIDAQPNFSTFDFTGKTYRIDQQLNLYNRNNITMLGGYFFTDDKTGDGSTVEAPSAEARYRYHWDIKGSTNIVIDGMTFRGPNALADGSAAAYVVLLEAQHAFNLSGCTNVEIKNCTISYIYGDWFFIGIHPTTGVWCDGIHIHHNTCSRAGRQGVAYTGARHSSFTYNDCQLMPRAFIDLEPNGSIFGADDIEIAYNTVGHHRLLFIASGGLGPIDNINIHHNTLTTQVGITGTRNLMGMLVMGDRGSRENWTVDNNTAVDADTTSGGCFMTFVQAKNVTVTNNTQPTLGGVMTLAYFEDCEGVTHQGNTMDGGSTSMFNLRSTRIRNCGNRLTAGGAFNSPEVCVADFGTAKQYPTLTGWFDAYQATDDDLAAVGTVTDWSGNARHLTATGTARPTFRENIGGQAIRSYQFDGVDDFAQSAALLGTFITGPSYTVFVVFTPTTISTSSANAYDNDAVLGDTVGVFGLHLHSTGPKAQAYNWDNAAFDVVEKTITTNQRVLIMMRHAEGNLYMAKDGAAETLVASGDTTDLVNAFLLLGKNYSGSGFFAGVINEINIYNAVLTAPQILDRTNRLYLDWKVAFVYGATDDFNRANGPIGTSSSGQPWIEPRGSHSAVWSVVSNKATLTTPDLTAGENQTVVESGLSDCTIQVDVDVAFSGGLVVRMQDGANWTLFEINGGAGSASHWTITDDSYVQVSTVTGLASSGTHTIKAVCAGTSVQFYFDATLVFDLTGYTHMQTATLHGFHTFTYSTYPTVATPGTFDNFSVTL